MGYRVAFLADHQQRPLIATNAYMWMHSAWNCYHIPTQPENVTTLGRPRRCISNNTICVVRAITPPLLSHPPCFHIPLFRRKWASKKMPGCEPSHMRDGMTQPNAENFALVVDVRGYYVVDAYKKERGGRINQLLAWITMVWLTGLTLSPWLI